MGKIALIGAMAKTPRYQGVGSSRVNPTRLDCAWDEASRSLAGQAQLSYAAGYEPSDATPNQSLIADTSFEYTDLVLENPELHDDQELRLSVRVRNSGGRAGKEVVQVYVGEDQPSVARPVRELRAFQKISLAPGESVRVEFRLDRRAFAFWATEQSGWAVNPGEYPISVGSSSADIRLRATALILPPAIPAQIHTPNTLLGATLDHPSLGQRLRLLRAVLMRALGNPPEGAAAGRARLQGAAMPFRIGLVARAPGKMPRPSSPAHWERESVGPTRAAL